MSAKRIGIAGARNGSSSASGVSDSSRRRATRCSAFASRAALPPGAHPLESSEETVLFEGLEQVIECLGSEGLEGVTLVRGDKDDRRPWLGAQAGRDIEPAGVRHLYVEEYDLGMGPFDRRDRLGSLDAFAHHLKVIVLGQQTAKPGSAQWLVVHDERSDPRRDCCHEMGSANRSGKDSVQTAPPSGVGTSANRCSAP